MLTAEPPTLPLLLDIRALAEFLGRSVSSLKRDIAGGRLLGSPKYVGSVRWRCREVEAWVQAGMPPRDEWKRLRGQWGFDVVPGSAVVCPATFTKGKKTGKTGLKPGEKSG
jgi:hypothetical protein